MLTRRQFVSILLMFAALLILFQGPVIVRTKQNNYSQNTTHEDHPIQVSYKASDQSAVYIGDLNSEAYKTCAYWAYLTKRQLLPYTALTEDLAEQLSGKTNASAASNKKEKKPDIVCMDRTVLQDSNNYSEIRLILQGGTNVVFMNLPDPRQVILDQDLQDLLGIYYVQTDRIKADGIHLYKGLLLGGERIYQAGDSEKEKKRQDLDLEMPWYVPSAGCHIFMSGIINESKKYNGLKNQDMPALIWQTPKENAFAYVINGDYMNDSEIGLGILDGIIADSSTYTIYPVINAQNLVLNGFPVLSDENDKEMRKIYGYSQTEFQKNIIQPAVWSSIRNMGFRPTAMTLASYDGTTSHVIRDQMPYYLRELREAGGEAGISYEHAQKVSLQKSIAVTDQILSDQAAKYAFGAAYISKKDLNNSEKILNSRRGSQITTILTDYKNGDPLFQIQKDGTVLQSILSKADRHTFTDDLRLLGDESALGYSTVSFHISDSLWPDGRKDEWENKSEDAFGNLETYWKKFTGFDKTTLSESSAKIRSFMNLQMTSIGEQQKDGSTVIHISSSGFGKEAAFLIRTNGMNIQKMSGGSFRKIEEGVYLLKITKTESSLTLGKAEVK